MPSKKNTVGISRRTFLAATGTSLTATIVPRHVLGAGQQPPSETITYCLIGNGGRADAGLKGMPGFKRIAVCDVDKLRIGGEPDNVTRFVDYRRVMDRKEIDLVCISTPPHWHALPSIAAAQAGKDIFCEKPMTKFIAEGRAMADAVRRYGTMFQIGTFGRFSASGAKANVENHKIIKHGLMKDLSGAVGYFVGHARTGKPALPAQPVPPNLDYDLWLGPAPYKPYNVQRVHYNNRFYWDYEGGDVTNFGHHSIDPVQWVYAKDDTGPVQVDLVSGFWPQHPDCVGPPGAVVLTYSDGVKLVYGADGKVQGAPRRSQLKAADLNDEGHRRLAALPDPPKLVSFGEAVRTRRQAGGNAEASHRAVTLLHLVNIAFRIGRGFRWDPAAEKIVGDEEANRFVDIPMRAPWHL
jgi:hypothetical protein